MQLDIHNIMASLSERRKVFVSEADFQFAFAWEIQKNHPTYDLRLEYCPVDIDLSMHVDILVSCDGVSCPIELKYRTLKFDEVIDGERVALKSHGAQDCGKYDFLKDIYRVERLIGSGTSFSSGYAIQLCNDPAYWAQPGNRLTCDYQFSFHDGAVKNGVMTWAEHTGKGTTRGREAPINLYGCYTMAWRDFSRISDARWGRFRYLAVQVGE